MAVAPGDTFRFDPEGNNKPHLWVVLLVFTVDGDSTEFAVIVSVTSMTPHADRTCVLTPQNAGGHPFVHHESYVWYGRMLEVETERLPPNASHQPVSRGVLVRIRDGAQRSPHSKRGIKRRLLGQ